MNPFGIIGKIINKTFKMLDCGLIIWIKQFSSVEPRHIKQTKGRQYDGRRAGEILKLSKHQVDRLFFPKMSKKNHII